MGKFEIQETAAPEQGHATFGLLEAGTLYLAERHLVLGTIASEQALGFHFGDDGTTTAVVGTLEQLGDMDVRFAVGRDLETTLREYELEKRGRAESEFCGFLTPHEATQLHLFGVARILGKEPNSMKVRPVNPVRSASAVRERVASLLGR